MVAVKMLSAVWMVVCLISGPSFAVSDSVRSVNRETMDSTTRMMATENQNNLQEVKDSIPNSLIEIQREHKKHTIFILATVGSVAAAGMVVLLLLWTPGGGVR
jgi:Flp pilus assembly protein TadB